MTEAPGTMDDAVAVSTGAGRFQTRIMTAGVEILADEPLFVGGLGSGPNPYQLLASALASCTTMTLQLYAERKKLPVTRVRTSVGHMRDAGATPSDRFTRRITIEGDLDEAQRRRMIEIADHCPVHRTLKAGARIETVADDAAPLAQRSTDHVVDMEALIAVGRGSLDFTL